MSFEPVVTLYSKQGPAGIRNGASFNDSNLARQLNCPITQLKIYYANIINGIQVFYGDVQTEVHGTIQGNQTPVLIDPGDYLTEISGYSGLWGSHIFILQLTLKTKNGKSYGPFGDMGNARNIQPFRFTAPDVSQILAFFGTVFSDSTSGVTAISSLGQFMGADPSYPASTLISDIPSTNLADTGALDDPNINLSTGKLSFSLPLVSLPGRNNLTADLGISYSSAIESSASTWNAEATTGVCGLGWSLPREQIICDTSGTGTRLDHTYYLVTENNLYTLVKTGSDAQGDVYSTQGYEFWQIHYRANAEKWTVVREDGIAYIYGGLTAAIGNDQQSDGNSIEWAVKHNNWIGDSISGDQQQFAIAWNLTRVVDRWGNTVFYTYTQDQRYVGTGPTDQRKYTRACYLSEIRGANGEKIALSYRDKSPNEYWPAHTYTGQIQTIRRITGTLDASGPGTWDYLSSPDPRITINLTGSNGYTNTLNLPEQTNQAHVVFRFDLPPDTPDVLTIHLVAYDVDWPDADDLMIDATFQNVAVNSGTLHSSNVVDYINEASITLDYVNIDLQADPVAYQDRLETQYLDHVVARSAEDVEVSQVTLGYDFIGAGKFQKRVLTSLEYSSLLGDPYRPPTLFAYYSSADGVSAAAGQHFNLANGAFYGALKYIITPEGQQRTYGYTQVSHPNASRDLVIPRPENNDPGWTAPHVYFGPNYTVVVWTGQSARANSAFVSVYTWVGRWVAADLGEFDEPNGVTPQVSLAADFFALLITGPAENAILFSRDAVHPGQWNTFHTNLRNIAQFQSGAGRASLALLDPSNGTLHRFLQDGSTWAYSTDTLVMGSKAVFGLAAWNNYIFAASAVPDNRFNPYLYLYYADPAALQWNSVRKQVPPWTPAPHSSSSSLGGGTADSDYGITGIHIEPGDSFVVLQSNHLTSAMAHGITFTYNNYRHFAYQWDELFSAIDDGTELGSEIQIYNGGANQVRLTVRGPMINIDEVAYLPTGLDIPDQQKKYTYRYLGTGWKAQAFANDRLRNGFTGYDSFTATQNGQAQYWQFNPTTLQWESPMPSYSDGNPGFFQKIWPSIYLLEGLLTLALGPEGLLLDALFFAIDLVESSIINNGGAGRVQGRFFTADNILYAKNNDGSWTSLGAVVTPYTGKVLGTYTGAGFSRSDEEDLSISYQNAQNASSYIAYTASVNRYSIFVMGESTSRQEAAGYPQEHSRIQLLKNGAPAGAAVELPAGESFKPSDAPDEPPLTGANAFMSYTGGASLAAAAGLHLYRVITDDFQGPQVDTVVSQVQVNDGYRNLYTHYNYDVQYALPSATGVGAAYNKVTVYYSGTSAQPVTANGAVEHYFYTGDGDVQFAPANSAFRQYPYLYKGKEYHTRVLDASRNVIAQTTSDWQVLSMPLVNHSIGYYTRPITTIAMVGNFKKVTSNTFTADSKGFPTQNTAYRYDLSGAQSTILTRYRYGWEVYPALLAGNILNHIVETTTSIDDIITGHEVTRWKAYTNGQGNTIWAPAGVYKALSAGADAFPFDDSPVDADQWRNTSQIKVLNPANGMITETADWVGLVGSIDGAVNTRGMVRSTIYDTLYRFPIATFTLASTADHEAGYYGFEDYEDATPWNLTGAQSSLPPGSVYTGQKAFWGNGSIAPRVFQPRSPSTPYIVSAWIKPRIPNSSYSIGFGEDAVSILLTGSGWQYVEYVTTAPQPDQLPFIRIDGAIDDFRFGPVDAPFVALIYDPVYQLQIAQIGTNGETVRFQYDNLQNVLALLGPDNQVLEMRWRQSARENSTFFTASTPNQNTLIRPRNGGRYLAQVVLQQTVTLEPDNRSNYGIRMSVPQKPRQDVVISSFDGEGGLFTGATAPDFGVQIGNARAVSSQGAITLYEGDAVRGYYRGADIDETWTFIVISNKVFLWLGKSLVFHATFQSAINGQLSILMMGQNNQAVAFDDVSLFYDPLITVTYTDAADRPIQTQTLNTDGNGVIARQNLYDGWGNLAIQTKPILVDNISLAYQPNIISQFDWISGIMQGTVVDYYRAKDAGDNANYPYTRRVAETNPLARTVEVALPGSAFRAGAGLTEKRDYGLNSAVTGLLHDNNVTGQQSHINAFTVYRPLSSGNYTLHTEIFNEQQENLTTRSGYPAAVCASRITRIILPGGAAQVTILPPNAFPGPSAGLSTQVTSDYWGRTAQHTDPDTGSQQFIYTPTGQVRFLLNDLGREMTPNRILYWKHDGLGRVVEEGYASLDWDAQQLQAYANQGHPLPDETVTARYTYDMDDQRQTTNLKGRMTQVESTASDGSSIRETFEYDIFSNVTATNLSVAASGPTVWRTEYQYDRWGNTTLIFYPRDASQPPGFTVVQAYNSLGQLSAITSQEPPNTYATYAYDLEGRLQAATINNGVIQRGFGYDFNGAPTGVIDSNGSTLFSEDLSQQNSDGQYQDGHIVSATYQGSAVGTPHRYLYSYNEQGWLTQAQTSAVPELNIDAHPTWDVDSGASTPGEPVNYDANGNILAIRNVNASLAFQHNAGNNGIQQVQVNGQASVCQYNANGGLVRSNSIAQIRYDPLSNLPQTIALAGCEVTLEYDGRKQRVLKKVTPGNTRLYVHGSHPYPLLEITDGVPQRMIYGVDGLLAVQSGQRFNYISRDHLGSTRVVTDSQGQVLASYSYQPFGSFLPANGQTSDAAQVRYLFTGQEYDEEVGLYNYRMRMYDPTLSIFYTPDPSNQYFSPYTYVGNNPVNYVDPTGTLSIPLSLGGYRLLISAASIVAYGALGAGLGAGIGAAIGGKSEAGQGAKLGAIIGGAIGGGLGLLRLMGEAVIVPYSRETTALRSFIADPAGSRYPVIAYNAEQRAGPFHLFRSGRLGAEMIAEAEGIPRGLWDNHLVSFQELHAARRTAPTSFNGRVIAVAHGNPRSMYMEVSLPSATWIDGSLFLSLFHRDGPAPFHFANAIQQIDLCVCGAGRRFTQTLTGIRQWPYGYWGTNFLGGWASARSVTPANSLGYLGVVRETGSWYQEALHEVFPFYLPGAPMPSIPAGANLGEWRLY